MGDNDKAIGDYNQAIQMNPKFVQAYCNRGYAYKAKGEFDKALADFDEAIQVDPQDAHPYNDLAWLLATCPQAGFRDGKKAVATATKSCALARGAIPMPWTRWPPPMQRRGTTTMPSSGRAST